MLEYVHVLEPGYFIFEPLLSWSSPTLLRLWLDSLLRIKVAVVAAAALAGIFANDMIISIALVPLRIELHGLSLSYGF